MEEMASLSRFLISLAGRFTATPTAVRTLMVSAMPATATPISMGMELMMALITVPPLVTRIRLTQMVMVLAMPVIH